MSEIHDLAQLKELDESAVLKSLEDRFNQGRIYTMSGPVLLAVNPFTPLPGLYAWSVIEYFKSNPEVGSPHIFGVAQAAYAGMSKGHKLASPPRNQSIVISGESGSGKTESTKLVMKYLALCGHSGPAFVSSNSASQSRVELQVLETNLLLEAFGNARTLRNDNSSRFGKYIQLQFVDAPTLRLGGARIDTYLLEKVRVVSQSEGERSFHIFYQCCAAASAVGGVVYEYPMLGRRGSENRPGETFTLRLSGFTDHSHFSYLTSSSSCFRAPSIDDLKEFENTIEAMRVIGMEIEEIEALLRQVAAVLHVGNIQFEDNADSGEGGCRVSVDGRSQNALMMACALLGIGNPEVLELALCCKRIEAAGHGVILTRLNRAKATEMRDAFAKHIYSLIFTYLVELVNSTMDLGERGDDNSMLDQETSTSVVSTGILDIFGFEYFRRNTFEQLCINYANERLQLLFTESCLAAEQAVYLSEGVPWNWLDFPTNENIISVLHGQTFPMLDEECRIVGGSDLNYLSKLLKSSAASGVMQPVKTKANWFIVQHFAGPVYYSVTQFVDKNKDVLSGDLMELLSGVVGTGQIAPNSGTVSGKFRNQLSSLIDTIRSTNSLFVRCIKPNAKNIAHAFDASLVADQLRYGGIFHAIRITRAGFPVRVPIAEFESDWRCLGRSAAQIIPKLVQQLGLTARGAQGEYFLGRTKLFFKRNLWDKISSLKNRMTTNAAIKVQKNVRMFIAKRRYQKDVLAALHAAQSMVKTALVLYHKRRNEAATKIQAAYSRYVWCSYYQYVLGCVVKIQRAVRRRILQPLSAKLKTAKLRNATSLLYQQMRELGAEIHEAKLSMRSIDRNTPYVRKQQRHSLRRTNNFPKRYDRASSSVIPPAPFFLTRTGAVESRLAGKENPSISGRLSNGAPTIFKRPPVLRPHNSEIPAEEGSTTVSASLEKRVAIASDEMAKMKALIDRLERNFN